MNKPDYNNPAVYKKSLGTLEDLLEKLFKFLKDRTPVSIRHADYIPCYELYLLIIFAYCYSFAFYASSQADAISEKLYVYFKQKTTDYATYS